jgi:hypothetical protein
MAKKKLGVRTKLTVPDPEEETEKPGLVKGIKDYPRSYRWRAYDMNLIESLVSKVNKVSNRRVDATKVIRGALYLAEKRKPEKLLDAIMEAEKNSMISKYK